MLGHVQRRAARATLMKSIFFMYVDGPPWARGWPKRTWMKLVRIDPK